MNRRKFLTGLLAATPVVVVVGESLSNEVTKSPSVTTWHPPALPATWRRPDGPSREAHNLNHWRRLREARS